jgi:phenylalanine-4-hydroxylase
MLISQLKAEKFKTFSERDAETWHVLYGNLRECRASMAHAIFQDGLTRLGITGQEIPDLDEVNRRLHDLTGWRGVPVTGLEMGDSFYPALARREFPIGNFIRDRDSLGYTPAPDIFHDLYGHIPFYANETYARFCEDYGKMALPFLNDPEKLKAIERFFWFTIEFGLVETPQGRRIFGAGILSSRDESEYSLSSRPVVRRFDIKDICSQDFRIDQIQPVLFVMKNPEELYRSLSQVAAFLAQ